MVPKYDKCLWIKTSGICHKSKRNWHSCDNCANFARRKGWMKDVILPSVRECSSEYY